MVEDYLNINKEAIRTILHEELGKTKVFDKFIPRPLSHEHKVMKSAHRRDVISATEHNPDFLKSIVTGGVSIMTLNQSDKVCNESQKIRLK
ncbi:hypothetical protein TNCV_4803401 [Trichonephila clavipes]|nr:hypothetical protein TNCV_4803401 [Trichonephila clavipes]